MSLYSSGLNQSSSSNVALTGYTWTSSTTNPTDVLTAEYNIDIIGKRVVIDFGIFMDTAGSGTTALTIPWQAGWPTPKRFSTTNAANETFGGSYYTVGASGDEAPATFTAGPGIIRRNAANNGDEFYCVFSTGTRTSVHGHITYQAA